MQHAHECRAGEATFQIPDDIGGGLVQVDPDREASEWLEILG